MSEGSLGDRNRRTQESRSSSVGLGRQSKISAGFRRHSWEVRTLWVVHKVHRAVEELRFGLTKRIRA